MKVAVLLEFLDRKVLVVGGGLVAYRKAKRLYEAKAQVRCVSLAYGPSFAKVPWNCETKAFEAKDLEGMSFVVAATEDRKVNQEIVDLCKEKGILSHCVQQEIVSDLSFMAQEKVKDLLVACSTDGKAPGFSKKVLGKMLETLKASDYERLEIIASLREQFIKSDMNREPLKELYDMTLEELKIYKANFESSGSF